MAKPARPGRTTRPWRPADDDPRSAEIRAVALELVARKGYDEVSIDEIAAEAAASKSTIYRRWTSKAELVVDAVRRNARQFEAPEDTGTLRGDLLALLDTVAGELNRDADLVIAVVAAARRDEELMRVVGAQLRGPGLAVGRHLLERAIARGEIAEGADTLLVDEVAMPMLMHQALLKQPVDKDYVVFVVDDVLLKLLRPVAP
ncbi:TetR/AcrR family transcriptional regulator [Streptomyces mangrovisoli]|uniref:HTH tetR-type domain-containing protein n=1 Tax=Streptomyces mangrovisoli TaxID=1428628 RepID=A0A1J4NSU4_9ACTN|nr:TetR/AcrR family transcriptional regulator [Streptomyces mangrovisoli]OIJ65495.1 hypothetical protein WN71_023400 [Streptomyces mangrovisoli]